ncbi:hypothetical protein FKP32DRAFT_1190240 [Trametes sanguinea]|nr:hypothetical protein FKP32DRAFT_1190240 [Trametes sanguinea]
MQNRIHSRNMADGIMGSRDDFTGSPGNGGRHYSPRLAVQSCCRAYSESLLTSPIATGFAQSIGWGVCNTAQITLKGLHRTNHHRSEQENWHRRGRAQESAHRRTAYVLLILRLTSTLDRVSPCITTKIDLRFKTSTTNRVTAHICRYLPSGCLKFNRCRSSGRFQVDECR